jgi:hypothetical protein
MLGFWKKFLRSLTKSANEGEVILEGEMKMTSDDFLNLLIDF